MTAKERVEKVKNSPLARLRDVVVIGALVAVAAVAAVAIATRGGRGSAVAITVCGETTYYSLSKDAVVSLGELDVTIEGGEAFVSRSTCPDGLCEKSGRISKAGERIVCLPCEIVISVCGESEFDAVTGGGA